MCSLEFADNKNILPYFHINTSHTECSSNLKKARWKYYISNYENDVPSGLSPRCLEATLHLGT